MCLPCCAIVIYNNKYAFGLQAWFWHRALKTQNFLSGKGDKGVSFHVNEVTVGQLLGNLGVGTRSGNQPCDWRVGTLSPIPMTFSRRLSSVTSGQWFNQSCLCSEASIKTQKDGFWDLPGWWTSGSAGRVACSVKAWKLHTLSPYLVLAHLFHVAVPELYLSIMDW